MPGFPSEKLALTFMPMAAFRQLPCPAHSVSFYFCLLFALLLSALPYRANGQADENLYINHIPGTYTFHIRARQASFTLLLERIAAQTGLQLHYAALPAGLTVNGDCTGELLDEALECLLNITLNTVVRYGVAGRPAEAWFLGGESGPGAMAGDIKQNKMDDLTDAEQMEIDPLLAQAVSPDPKERLIAVMNIGAAGANDLSLTKKTLIAALDDPDPEIRARAIASLARIDAKNSTPQLRQMLNDSADEVRLATVVAAYDNRAVLEQALNDSNDQVSSAAYVALNNLNQARQ